MKLIEHLSVMFARNRYKEDLGGLTYGHIERRMIAEEAFEKGFESAKKLATDIIIEELKENTPWVAHARIASLGEKEL